MMGEHSGAFFYAIHSFVWTNVFDCTSKSNVFKKEIRLPQAYAMKILVTTLSTRYSYLMGAIVSDSDD